MSSINRRDFIKLASLFSLLPLVGKLDKLDFNASNQPNIIILLLDQLSAQNMSLYGYPRQTTPNMQRFAERAIVYHNHHSAANYTTPSTASLLTGAYPWLHRAFHIAGLMDRDILAYNIFNVIHEAYQRVGYANNGLADVLLSQLDRDIDLHVDMAQFNEFNATLYNHLFPNDPLPAFRGLEAFLYRKENPGSLFLDSTWKSLAYLRHKLLLRKIGGAYPRGVPYIGDVKLPFTLEALFQGAGDLLAGLPAPFFAYMHFYPPHQPYLPAKEFTRLFKDDYRPPKKPEHFFSEGEPYFKLTRLRAKYDQYIAHTDAVFGLLIDHMENRGLLDNSYVFVTSDHGHLFERGVHSHLTQLLYEPLLHIPLMVSLPGQKDRQDITSNTSNIDLLPTILDLSGNGQPNFFEGQVLPGLGGVELDGNSVYALEAKNNDADAPLTIGTLALIKDRYKMIRYFGYPGYENVYELFDLESDPEEMIDLVQEDPSLAQTMRTELDAKLEEVNQPFV